MAELNALVRFLDETLNAAGVPEPYASNGLQVECSSEVTSVGFATDAAEQTFSMLADCQLIVCHHGLFWPKVSRLTGAMGRQVAQLVRQGSSLYASHLPLDVHPQLGNNAQMIARLGLRQGELFPPVGYLAEPAGSPSLPLQEFHRQVEHEIGTTRLLQFGSASVRRVAVSSGQASVGMVDQAVSAGADTLLTGEAGHPIYHAALQAGLNVLLAGHYQTEVWGVRALMPLLAERFGVATRFVDVPTGF